MSCEAIGDHHLKMASRDIAEIKERMRILTEKIQKEEDTDEREALKQILIRLESALDAAQMGEEYMKVSMNAAYDMIGKKPTDKEGTIKKTKKYECKVCSFNTSNVKILEDHVSRYHRPQPIRAVSDTSRKT